MTIRNDELAALFEEMADLLEAMDVEYKPVAYRRAAEQISEHPENVAGIAREEGAEGVKTINRVGDAIASKVLEYTEQGEIAELEELRAELPVDMDGLTSVEGVGPKTVGTLYEQLGIRTLEDLETAARANEIQEVKGFGPKTEENILSNIDFARQSQERTLLGDALPLSESVRAYLEEAASTERCVVAGSLRRRCSTIGDVDVLTASTDHAAVIEAFTAWSESDKTIEAGTNKASIRSSGARIDLRVVDPSEFGGALQYFTGSKEHNIAIRNQALARDLKVNEYGVFDIAAVEDPSAGQRVGERIGGETEEEIYSALDLPLIPPELREDRGEIEAAESGTLPDLITHSNVRGDLHVHTEYSDGQASIQEMVTAAAERGHEYLCITDHATGPGMVGGVGLDDGELEEQLAEIQIGRAHV